MEPLSRSSTTRRQLKQGKEHSTNSRLRPISHLFIRRQRSDSCVNKQGHRGLTSESRSPSHLTLHNQPVPIPSLTSPSFLTVESAAGGTSSIDSESEDDDDDADLDDTHSRKTSPTKESIRTTTSHGNTLPVSGSGDNEFGSSTLQPPMSPSANERSLTHAFKDKLHLSRSASKRAANTIFGLLMKKHADDRNAALHRQQQLYDNGTQSVYPPPQKKGFGDASDGERDKYGFVKSTQWISHDDYIGFDRTYKPIMKRRVQKWQQLMGDNDGQWPQHSSKVKRYIRKGIPPELRGQAWFHYSGAEEKMANNPGVYEKYLREAESLGYENEHLDIIERDLHRTFPDNAEFQPTDPSDSDSTADIPKIQSLRRVLSAFSLYSPSIGYCQSLNYIAGLLLLFMKNDEEAFWTLVAITHDILPSNTYDVTMEGANIDQAVLMMLLSERCPEIWRRLSGNKTVWECEGGEAGLPTCSFVTSHWFLTLFINILPIESVLRVWDCLLYEGQRALFRVALAIFMMNKDEILSVTDPLEVFQIVQNMPKRMIDCHKLMDATYHKYASLTRVSEPDFQRQRDIFKARRDERRKSVPPPAPKLKRGTMRGTILHKAREAKKFVDRAKSVRKPTAP